jgi:DnaK suppressor protein
MPAPRKSETNPVKRIRSIVRDRGPAEKRAEYISAFVLKAFEAAQRRISTGRAKRVTTKPATPQRKNGQGAPTSSKGVKAAAKACARPAPGPKKDVKLTTFLKTTRERLQQLRDAVLDDLAETGRDALRSSGDENKVGGVHQTDAASDQYDRDFALSVISKHQDGLYEIEEALKRIENGTYGICELCGKPIPAARLEALPFARLTVDCQAQAEEIRFGCV